MSQTRLYLRALRATAQHLHDRFDDAFEDDGYPLAIGVADEAHGIHEVSIYTDTPASVAERMHRIIGEAGEMLTVESEDLDDVDWVARSLEGLKPVRAGGFVAHGAHDRDTVRAGETAIEIEAGQAFGTGHHGTTAGCLEMIDRLLKRHQVSNALDLGTGSGVLAIALAKRRRRAAVLATDIDPVAVAVAAANVRLNAVSTPVTCLTASGFRHRAIAEHAPYDLIVANILAGPLMAMAPHIARGVRHGGHVILSGILDHQYRRVLAACRAQGLHRCYTLHRDGWATLLLSR